MNIERMMKALGEPMRFKIYKELLERPHCVRSLSQMLGITDSAVSQHLKVMREAELVHGEKYGYHTHFLPRQDAIDALAGLFLNMQKQAASVDRSTTICNCKFRKEENMP